VPGPVFEPGRDPEHGDERRGKRPEIDGGMVIFRDASAFFGGLHHVRDTRCEQFVTDYGVDGCNHHKERNG
jgi:hypothetical protein